VQDRRCGSGGSGIVAKWCPRTDGELETFIYTEVLQRLSIDSIRCYGFIDEGGGDYGWLFLEDGGIKQIADKGASFPIAFAHWLALLHGSASSLPIRDRLPERGPAWYWKFYGRLDYDFARTYPNEIGATQIARLLKKF